MVSLLQQKGLLTRTPHPRDGRARRVRLSSSGRRLLQEMSQGSKNIRLELAALFNPKEQRTLIEFLDRLAKAMRPPARKAPAGRSLAKALADT